MIYFLVAPDPSTQLPAPIPDIDDSQIDNSDNPGDGDISEDGAAGPSSGRIGRKPRTSLPTAKGVSKFKKK